MAKRMKLLLAVPAPVKTAVSTRAVPFPICLLANGQGKEADDGL